MFTKLVGTGVSLVAGLIGTKVIAALWEKTTGEEPPVKTNPNAQRNASLSKVVTFAVISGSIGAIIQAITNRWALKMSQDV